ncbi:hypothetical protein ABES21_21180 [Peribacillus frigoritolerans]|uniref:hypothetical protein n=1 Tax=Peribacillus frigoritolerans TaxID=450367 RepID=UPI003D26D613
MSDFVFVKRDNKQLTKNTLLVFKSCNIFHVNCGSIVKNHQMPINLCASPTFNKETRIIMNRNDGEWQKETEENQSATCLQMAEGNAHCVKEQE